MATRNISYGTYSALTVTNLQSLASSATAGWQSARISNLSDKAKNYEIVVKMPMANTAPANDQAAYVYASPAVTTDGGTTWLHADQGTTTLPSGSEGTTTIATPNQLKLLGVLRYTTQQMTLQGVFFLCPQALADVPDGFSLIIVNYTGAAASTGCVVAVRPIYETLA